MAYIFFAIYYFFVISTSTFTTTPLSKTKTSHPMGPLCCILQAKNTVSTSDDGKREAKRCNTWLEFLQPIRSMLSRNPGWSVTTSKRMRWRRLAAPPLSWNPRANPATKSIWTNYHVYCPDRFVRQSEGVCWQKWGSLFTWILSLPHFIMIFLYAYFHCPDRLVRQSEGVC